MNNHDKEYYKTGLQNWAHYTGLLQQGSADAKINKIVMNPDYKP
jgi:hypothetical protein